MVRGFNPSFFLVVRPLKKHVFALSVFPFLYFVLEGLVNDSRFGRSIINPDLFGHSQPLTEKRVAWKWKIIIGVCVSLCGGGVYKRTSLSVHIKEDTHKFFFKN